MTGQPFLLAMEVTRSMALGMLTCVRLLVYIREMEVQRGLTCLSWRYPAVLVKIKMLGVDDMAVSG